MIWGVVSGPASSACASSPAMRSASLTHDDGDPRVLIVLTDGSRDARSALAAHAIQSGWGLEELSPQRSSLEEVFLRVVTEDEDAA